MTISNVHGMVVNGILNGKYLNNSMKLNVYEHVLKIMKFISRIKNDNLSSENREINIPKISFETS